MSTAAQIKCIQTLRRKAGIEDPEYRGFLLHHGGKTSSKELSDAAADRVIAELRKVTGPATAPKGRTAANTATGAYAPLLQALWISAWNLGLARSKDDTAMLAFVKRQTGLDHTRFLVDGEVAARAIEGLKRWIARDGGVTWPTDGGRISDDPHARKHAVCRAIVGRLVAIGGFTPFVPGTDPWPVDIAAYGRACGLPSGFTDYDAKDWDDLANLLGARLRGKLAAKARAEKEHAA